MGTMQIQQARSIQGLLYYQSPLGANVNDKGKVYPYIYRKKQKRGNKSKKVVDKDRSLAL